MSILLRNILLAVLASASTPLAAHDGGLDADGCHHDREGHHCHPGSKPQSQPVQDLGRDQPGRSLDATGGAAIRDCTAARSSCVAIEQSVDGTKSSSAGSEAREEERGTQPMLEASGPGVLTLAGLFALGVYLLRGLQGRRSQHRH